MLQKIGHLFTDQANPTGESYAVQKILAHYTADLRAVFLHYAQVRGPMGGGVLSHSV